MYRRLSQSPQKGSRRTADDIYLQCIPYVFLYFIDGDDDGELHIDT